MRKLLILILSVALSFTLVGKITNPDKPLKGVWDFQMKKIWETDPAGEHLFGPIQNMRTSKDGRLYLLDVKQYKVHILGPDGKYLSSFGKKGEGPGEIKRVRLGSQLFMFDDEIAIYDGGRIHYYSLDGVYSRTALIPPKLKPRIFISRDEFISAPYTSSSPDEKIKVQVYNIINESKRVIVEVDSYANAFASSNAKGAKQGYYRIVLPGVTPQVYMSFKNGKLYYGRSDAYHFRIVDINGKQLGEFSLEGRDRNPVSKAYKERMKKRMPTQIPPDVVKKIFDGLPEKIPFFNGLLTDKKGLFHVYVSDPDNRTRRLIDIFSPEGKYLYSACMKMGEGVTMKASIYTKDGVVIMYEDEDGHIKLALFSVKMPTL